MQYICIYYLLLEENIHIVTHIQQHDWWSTNGRRFMCGPDVRHTDRRRVSGCTPVPSWSHTSWGKGSFQAAHSQTAVPATACEKRYASWCLSGSGWGPWCSSAPSAEFHTWTVFCLGPTAGPLCVNDQKLCSNPPSSSSLWHWQPSSALWQSHTSLGSWSPVPRTLILSRCSLVGGTSWFLGEEPNECQIRKAYLSLWCFQFQLQGSSEVSSVLQSKYVSKLCTDCQKLLIVDSLKSPRCLWCWRQWRSSFYKLE